MNFQNTNNILYEHQYGFRAKHSTIHPIMYLINHCAEADNKHNPEYTLAVFCDLSKAFDVIHHKIFLHKLKIYGIRGLANDWCTIYLSNKTQFVEIDLSKFFPQTNYVWWASRVNFRALAVLLYVNDIHKSCESSILSLYISDNHLISLFETSNKEINKLYKWFCANKLSLNANKTKYIVIRPKHRRCDPDNMNVFFL